MADCVFLRKCAFFQGKLSEMPIAVGLFKDLYCLRDHSICARYIVRTKLGKEAVPSDLFPHHEERAMAIISDA